MTLVYLLTFWLQLCYSKCRYLCRTCHTWILWHQDILWKKDQRISYTFGWSFTQILLFDFGKKFQQYSPICFQWFTMVRIVLKKPDTNTSSNGWSTNHPPPPTYTPPRNKVLYGLIKGFLTIWFPFIRPKIKPVFLGGGVRDWRVGWPAMKVRV